MQAPPKPDNEAQRLATLRSLQILDTPPEERFDRITRTAQRLFDVPIALVSLVDENRQWFKSCYGLSTAETPRDMSFCGHAIQQNDLFVIENALEDARFADNPLVTGGPDIRFYAGCPLHATNGASLGTLCIIDRKPHVFDAGQRGALADLGHWAEQELNLLDLQAATTLAQEHAARLHAIVDNVVDGIVSFNAQGLIESLNKAASEIFGYAMAELIGAPFLVLLEQKERDKYQAYLRDYLVTGQARVLGSVVESVGLHRRGNSFPIEFAVNDLNIHGRHLFTAIVRDITERKNLERMKNEFISTVSHELRTPLTSIRGSLGLIAGGAVGAMPEQAKELIDIACNNSDRLVRLINDILDVEKIESGKMTFRTEPVDLVALINEAMSANSAYAAQHSVTFALVEQVPDARVDADPDRLTQVITNLLSNATKFSPPDRRVDVAIRRLKTAIRVQVTDYGPGIPEEFQTRIFQKFAQADASDTRLKGGTGLGLSISKAIIERLGGTIGFTTGADGTTFYFDLRPSAAAVGAGTTGATADAPRQPTILICEDDPDVAHLLSMMLAQSGYASDIAYDAAQAKQCLRERGYVAMTLDIMLPGQDGIALIRELRLDPALRQLPIVVVSAKSDQGRVELNGDALAVVDWLSKPIDTARLLAAVALAAQRGGSHRARILYVEDDADIVHVVSALLQDKAELFCAGSLAAARRSLAQHAGEIDLVILDIGLPDGSGLDLLPELRRPDGTPLQVVVFSSHEVSAEIARRVALSLVKSRTSNQSLLDGILALLGKPTAG